MTGIERMALMGWPAANFEGTGMSEPDILGMSGDMMSGWTLACMYLGQLVHCELKTR